MLRWSVLAMCLMLGGCASWKSVAGGDGNGYDVYRPEPYLLIVRGRIESAGEVTRLPGSPATTQASAHEVQYSAKIIWLPDYSQRYRISPGAFSSTTVRINDGWQLASISDESSVAELAGHVVSGAESVGATGLSAVGMLGDEATAANGPLGPEPAGGGPAAMNSAFGLYKIIYDRDGHVTGLVKMTPGVDASSAHHTLADHIPPSVLPPPKPPKEH